MIADMDVHVCPTPCDSDCAEPCHEVHIVRWRRTHEVPDDNQQAGVGVTPP